MALLVTACGGGGDTSEGAVSVDDANEARLEAAPGRESQEDPLERERQAVVDAHAAAMEARIDSSAPPEPQPDFPALAETHVDPMLAEWRQQLDSWAFTGHAVQYPEDSQLSVEVLHINFGWASDQEGAGATADREPGSDEVGDVATLVSCVVDDGVVVDTETGETEGELTTIHETATLRKVDGVWMLADRVADTDWPGRSGCAAD